MPYGSSRITRWVTFRLIFKFPKEFPCCQRGGNLLSSSNGIIRVSDLVKKYGEVAALKGLDLEVFSGELYGFLGPNGAGKTTTINVLTGLTVPTSGEVILDGFHMPEESGDVKRDIGLCPQITAVYDYLTGRENVEFFGGLQGMEESQISSRTKLLLRSLGLEGDADRRVGEYSGGMKRRINLAMGLVHGPKMVFLDEPTVGMDPQSRHAVWDFLMELKESRKTLILTTHYMEEAEILCDRVGIIDHGRLIGLGSPEELMKDHDAQNLEEVFLDLTGRTIREEM